MATKSSKQIVSGFQRLYLYQIPSKPTSPIPSRPYSTQFSTNGIISRSLHQTLKFPVPTPRFSNPSQLISIRNLSTGKLSSGLVKSLFKGPLSKVKSRISQYREAVGLQVESFWKRNYLVLVGTGGVVVCIALWRVMFGVASTFVGLSEGMAKYGFLALAAAMVSFGYDVRLLAVDMPMAHGPDQRIFIIGDEEEYKVGVGLIAELRDPIVKAMAAEKEFEDLDEKEEEDVRDHSLQLPLKG